ncbi:ZIP family metal transporter [Fibrobacter sp.]|uniref:ZIP family metal transporter n=1 Tax=Fibrobacter sp. TaxID=35828 RepID=UPI003891133F
MICFDIPVILVALGVGIPFVGTVLGSACVFFAKKPLHEKVRRGMMAFAAGVMVAAAVWSLLIPSIEASRPMAWGAVLPFAGFWLGVLILFAIDKLTPHLHLGGSSPEGLKVSLSKSAMIALAVTIHNIPEGMAIGVVFAGWLTGASVVPVSLSSAIAVSLGIAVQNFPEGAIVSLPLRAEGASRKKAFLLGLVSAVAEALAAIVTLLLSQFMLPALPCLLALAAGAMVYVVVEELLPEASTGVHFDGATLLFAVGFSMMMLLDTAL